MIKRFAVFLPLVCCTQLSFNNHPKSVLRAYSDALAQGQTEVAYSLLSDEVKRTISLESFRVMLKQNQREAQDLSQTLTRPMGDPYVTARVPLASGDVVTFTLENGRWRIDATAFDFYSQTTPRLAMIGFIRALHRNRFDILLKYTPESHKQGLSLPKLQAAWSTLKPEGKRVREIVEEIRTALPNSTVEETGDRAVLQYNKNNYVSFVREQGLWKVEDFQ